MMRTPQKTLRDLLPMLSLCAAVPLLPQLPSVPVLAPQVKKSKTTATPVRVVPTKAARNVWRSALYGKDWNPGAKQFETDRLIQDFSYAGYQRGEKPIPKVAGPVFNVVTEYGADPRGIKDSTVPIQNAIDAASKVGGVVYLPAGTFKVKPQDKNTALLITDKLVLRGAGRNRTFLFNDAYNMRGKSIITARGAGTKLPAGSPETEITRDLLAPTVTIPVADVTGFAAGDWIMLRADATEAFIAEHNMADLWGGMGKDLGGVTFQRQITAINAAAKTFTVDIPLRYYLKTRDRARVEKARPCVEEVGLEDFSVGNLEHPGTTGWGEVSDYQTAGTSAYQTHASFAVLFSRARNCWMSGVASYRPAANKTLTHFLSNGVGMNNCRSITLKACEFQRAQYGGGGGNGYIYRMTNTQECLLENCIARYGRHNMVFADMGTSGNVIHGGLTQSTGYQVAGVGATRANGSDHHMYLSQSNLVDGVQVDKDFFNAYNRMAFGTMHGQTGVHTVYWNLQGQAYFPRKDYIIDEKGKLYFGGKDYIVLSEQARYGYIIGTRGPASNILLGKNLRSLPLDHAEGIGKGDTLEPKSLYLDQRQRRIGW